MPTGTLQLERMDRAYERADLKEIEAIPEETDFGARVLPDELWDRVKPIIEDRSRFFGTPVYKAPWNARARIRNKPIRNALWGGMTYGYLVKESEYPLPTEYAYADGAAA